MNYLVQLNTSQRILDRVWPQQKMLQVCTDQNPEVLCYSDGKTHKFRLCSAESSAAGIGRVENHWRRWNVFHLLPFQAWWRRYFFYKFYIWKSRPFCRARIFWIKGQWFLMYTLFLKKEKKYFCFITPILASFKAGRVVWQFESKENVIQYIFTFTINSDILCAISIYRHNF